MFALPAPADDAVAAAARIDSLIASLLPEQREEAAGLLGKQGDTAAAKRLIRLLKDDDWGVRMAAIAALGRIGWDEAFPILEPLAGAREWWLRAAAFEGLYHTYTKAVIPILLDAFNDRNAVARMTARRNLRYMTGKHYAHEKLYVQWWEKWKDKLELKHPEKKLAELDKYGYSTSHFFLQKEGFAHESDPRRRMVFAVDNLGLTIKEVRELAKKGAFKNVNDTTAISKSYSMFHMLVNFINEKRRIDLTR